VTKPCRLRWIGLIAVTSGGLLSGCYYPYGYYNPWVYPYPYPSAAGYPYPPAPGVAPQYPQQPASGAASQYPQQPVAGAAPQYPQQRAPGALQPLNEPVQITPLPPEPVPQ
jgi:hypothetical protein